MNGTYRMPSTTRCGEEQLRMRAPQEQAGPDRQRRCKAGVVAAAGCAAPNPWSGRVAGAAKSAAFNRSRAAIPQLRVSPPAMATAGSANVTRRWDDRQCRDEHCRNAGRGTEKGTGDILPPAPSITGRWSLRRHGNSGSRPVQVEPAPNHRRPARPSGPASSSIRTKNSVVL